MRSFLPHGLDMNTTFSFRIFRASKSTGVWILLSFLLLSAACQNIYGADDIASILDKVDRRDTAPAPEPKKTPQKKNSSTTTKKQATPSKPEIPIWAPRDKLPKDIVGHGLAGNFVISGEDVTGGAVLIPAEDAANPFARQFTVANMSTGMAKGTLIPITQRRLLQIPKQSPLIFIGRGILPGTYIVESP